MDSLRMHMGTRRDKPALDRLFQQDPDQSVSSDSFSNILDSSRFVPSVPRHNYSSIPAQFIVDSSLVTMMATGT
jgi:hypothetical protein